MKVKLSTLHSVLRKEPSKRKIKLLKEIFSDPENIELFGYYFLPHHITTKTPEFHNQIYKELFKPCDSIIVAPRGHAKSTLTNVVFTIFNIVNKLEKYILMVSDSKEGIIEHIGTIKHEIESNEKLNAIYGDMRGDKWLEDKIIANGVMVRGQGAGSQIRGAKFRQSRPTLIILDDIVDDEHVLSKTQRTKLLNWYNRSIVPAKDHSTGKIKMINTILHNDDLPSNLLNMVNEKNEKVYSSLFYSAITETGKPLWSDIYSLEKLESIKNKIGSYSFSTEYLNKPILPEEAVFKPDWLKYYTDLPDGLTYYSAIDPSGKAKETSDYCAIVVVGTRKIGIEREYYVAETLYGHWSLNELIMKAQRVKEKWNVKEFAIESNATQGRIREMMSNYKLNLQELNHKGDKAQRIRETLQPDVEYGRIKFHNSQTELISEMIEFPYSKNDDVLDALAMAKALVPKNTFVVDNDVTPTETTGYYNKVW